MSERLPGWVAFSQYDDTHKNYLYKLCIVFKVFDYLSFWNNYRIKQLATNFVPVLKYLIEKAFSPNFRHYQVNYCVKYCRMLKVINIKF